jgi:uroporphyrinogen III methyltransferase/synthase
VAFVGGGPGDPGLLTRRGERLLAEAEVVVVDSGVPPALLDLISDAAERVAAVEVGGDVAALLVARAAAGRRVVRLVGGDAEGVAAEAGRVAAAGVRLRLVPGVSGAVRAALEAALGPAAAGPLAGRRVVVTRPRAQAAALATLLEDDGAEVLALPTIRLEPPADWAPLDAALGALEGFAWVVFTSTNGVAAFGERLARAGRDARALGRSRLAAIGPATAEALGRLGLRADAVPDEYRAEGLLDALRPSLVPGERVLLVRAAEARDVLPRGLEAAGARVTVAPAYRTRPAAGGGDRLRALLAAGAVDAVTFTSASTVHGFMALLGPERREALLADVALAAIGPITEAALAGHGVPATVVAREYTIPALAAALAAHLASRRAAARAGG